MGTRPLPDKAKRESFRQLIARKRAELLALGFTSKPVVEPKHRPSGPHLDQRWHQEPAQFAMNAEHEGLLSDKRCCGCGNKVIRASGELISDLWCGACWLTQTAEPLDAA